MRRIVLSVYITLDGVIDMDENAEWTFPYWNDELERYQSDLIERASALLLGRKTYEGFASSWPDRTNDDDPMADRMNTIPKHIASRTLKTVTWNASLLEGDAIPAVKELKSTDGGPLLVYAGGEFVGALIEAGLIDEYHLIMHPVTLGQGKRLFPEGVQTELRLVRSHATAKGVTIIHLEVQSPSMTRRCPKQTSANAPRPAEPPRLRPSGTRRAMSSEAPTVYRTGTFGGPRIKNPDVQFRLDAYFNAQARHPRYWRSR